MTYALVLASYVLGATPTSFWVGKAVHGVDLRERGSGNLGATNAFRVLGWRSALPVVVLDVAKGYGPVRWLPSLTDAGFGWALAFGAAAIVGHMFSFWVGFRGGKGVATSGGVFLAIAPLAVLGSFTVWLLAVLATGYVSVGSIAAAVVLPGLVWATPHAGGGAAVGFAGALAAVVVWAHRTNLRRLRRGEENRFRPWARGESGGPDDTAGSEGP